MELFDDKDRFHVFQVVFRNNQACSITFCKFTNIQRATQILGSKLAASSWIDIYLSRRKDQLQVNNEITIIIVPTDNFLYPYLQRQNMHVHVLVTGNHIICISNSH